MNIFIGSLPYSTKDGDLEQLFTPYGVVESARIISDRYSGRSKGFGFVEMPDAEAAKKAIEELNGSELGGRTIVVNEANEKPAGERRDNGDRGGYQRRNNGYNDRRGYDRN
ncbi:MAG: RNA-binding protein [Bacteroidales bacterium]|nr:RNA-binding protein [Bacteroidales bacterium]